MFRLISPNSWVFFSALLLFLFQRRLDILKIDVEGAEWPSLAEMMKSKSMDNVRQLMVNSIYGEISDILGKQLTVRIYPSLENFIHVDFEYFSSACGVLKVL